MKAKAFFLIWGLIFITTSLFSQESIIKKDNSVMKVKILEIQENSIEYKPIEFLDGPVRSIPLSEISHVVYENGKIETFNTPSVQKTTPSKIDLLARISIQVWENEELSEFFGVNISFGAGLEKQLLSHIKIGASFDFAGKSQYEVALNYFQIGGFVKFSWGDFGKSPFLIYTELGPRAIFLKQKEYESSLTESGFGVSAVLGAYIRLSPNFLLDLRWDTTWGNIDLSGYKLKTDNNLFSIGIIFSL